MITVVIARADAAFDASFAEPDFSLFENASAFVGHIFRRLGPHGLQLGDLRVERGSGSMNDLQIVCHMLNYWLTVRFRVDRVEIVCSELPENYVEAVKVATLNALTAVRDHRPNLAFRTFGLGVGLHATFNDESVKEYLSRFISGFPKDFGPPTGNGVVFYFGAQDDRLHSSITADVSALVANAAFLRFQTTWDPKKVGTESFVGRTEAFVDNALAKIGLQRRKHGS